MFALVKARWVFVYGASLLLLANGSYGDGAYERTKDGKTLVWNNSPRPEDAATWSGDRDEDEYATGHGTMTWYRAKRVIVTGSNIPSLRYIAVVRYSGNMVRGKLDGPVVTLDAYGRTLHAKFVDGGRATDWVAGPASAPISARDKRPIHRATLVEAPAEGPSPVQSSASGPEGPTPQREVRGQTSEVPDRPAHQHVSEPAVAETPSPAIDDSLRELVGPPPLLRTNAADGSPQVSVPSTASSPPARPRLSQAEVIGLADAEARAHGYDLGKYQRPQAHYTTEDGTWSVSYDQKSADGMTGKHFSVSVEEKTKKTSVVAGK